MESQDSRGIIFLTSSVPHLTTIVYVCVYTVYTLNTQWPVVAGKHDQMTKNDHTHVAVNIILNLLARTLLATYHKWFGVTLLRPENIVSLLCN